MKKQIYYAILFLLLVMASCVKDSIGTETSYNPEDVWEYNGDIAVLNQVIKELKSGSEGGNLEKTLLKNDVLWEESKFLFIDNKRRILVPFLSEDKNTVQGVLSLVKDAEGKTTFAITDRYLSVRENSALPFWDGGTWLGYFLALDKDILGTKNGNPGTTTRFAKNKPKSALTMRMECSTQQTGEIVFYQYSYVLSPSGDVSSFNFEITKTEPIYSTVCYEVPDPVIPPSAPAVPSGGGSTPAPTPAPAPAPMPPSCQAFGYSKVGTSNWQAAATKNIVALIGYYDLATGEYNIASALFPQPIYFEMPINSPSNGGYISSGRAAELTALAISTAISRAKYYFLSTNASSSQVQAKLWEYIRDEMTNGTHIIGGKASFTPPLGFNGEIKDFKAYWFLPDNCN